MTAPTPEQIRALADRAVQTDDGHTYSVPARDLVEYNATLRAVADQLEAVQELHRWLRKNISSPALHVRLDQFTAETAPQEDRDA